MNLSIKIIKENENTYYLCIAKLRDGELIIQEEAKYTTYARAYIAMQKFLSSEF